MRRKPVRLAPAANRTDAKVRSPLFLSRSGGSQRAGPIATPGACAITETVPGSLSSPHAHALATARTAHGRATFRANPAILFEASGLSGRPFFLGLGCIAVTIPVTPLGRGVLGDEAEQGAAPEQSRYNQADDGGLFHHIVLICLLSLSASGALFTQDQTRQE